MAPDPGPDFIAALSHALEAFIGMGFLARNVAIYFRPQDIPGYTGTGSRQKRPLIARLCDRGDPTSVGSDLCAAQLFALALSRYDPFVLASVLFSSSAARNTFASGADDGDVA